MADDLLIPFRNQNTDGFVVISHEDRMQIAATFYVKLLKNTNDWKAAVKRLEAINEKMPEKIISDIRERWLSSIEEWLNTRDTLKRLQLTKAEIETIAAQHHHKLGMEEAVRMVETFGNRKNPKASEDVKAALREVANNIRQAASKS